MKKWEKGFKVVHRTEFGELHSAVPLHGAPVQYAHGLVTYPPKDCGPLCVFGELESARFYMQYTKQYMKGWSFEMWECQYTPAKENKVWVDNMVSTLNDLPTGTRLADAVKLAKLLERAE